MDGFQRIYGENEAQDASAKCFKALTLYCVAAVIFAALCAMFVLLYVLAGVHVLICFFVNFLLTVLFCWATVCFFAYDYRKLKANRRFYRMFANSDPSYVRTDFIGDGGECDRNGVLCLRLNFCAADGEKTLYVKNTVQPPFIAGKTYDIKVVGSFVEAYKEAENGQA